MNSIAVNELKSPRALKARLRDEHELLLTSNGKPVAILLNVGEGEDPEEALQAVRMARSQQALRRVRETARRSGKDRISQDEIDALIRSVRASRGS
jgi:PHD/YefM family antitoxin component YafN of YafNO toxin-antitoxin module